MSNFKTNIHCSSAWLGRSCPWSSWHSYKLVSLQSGGTFPRHSKFTTNRIWTILHRWHKGKIQYLLKKGFTLEWLFDHWRLELSTRQWDCDYPHHARLTALKNEWLQVVTRNHCNNQKQARKAFHCQNCKFGPVYCTWISLALVIQMIQRSVV